MADAHKNFAYSTVATAPSPAASGTSLVVASGQGALFPAVPFNATIWPVSVQPTSANAEIVRVTARSTDTLTITRTQEGTSARTVVVGDQIAATITALTLTDSELPAGVLQMYAATAAPTGYLLCDGTAVSRTTYANLFTAIGTNYGVGDGTTTFNVPDLRGRVPVGYAASGGHTDVSTLGNNDGAVVASRRPMHKHNATSNASSTGTSNATTNVASGGSPNSGGSTYALAAGNIQGGTLPGVTNVTTNVTTNVAPVVGPQTGSEPTDAPAYVVVNYIIKT